MASFNSDSVKCKSCNRGYENQEHGVICSCCTGNWQDCPNCAEPKKTPAQKEVLNPVTPADIAIAAARYNVKYATPENKAWAEKRLAEEVQKAEDATANPA